MKTLRPLSRLTCLAALLCSGGVAAQTAYSVQELESLGGTNARGNSDCDGVVQPVCRGPAFNPVARRGCLLRGRTPTPGKIRG